MKRHKILYIVSIADATSIPLELASHFSSLEFDLTVTGFYRHSPAEETGWKDSYTLIGAKGPFDAQAFRRFYRLVKELRPDLIHVHHTWSAMLCALLGRLSGVPFIVKTEHRDHRSLSTGQRLVNLVTNVLSDAVVCNSRFTYHSFSRWEDALVRSKKRVIYNGVT